MTYNFDKSLATSLGMTGASVFVSATNLLTITKWPGLDPELVGSSMFAGSSKEDPYPLSRTFSMGVRLQF